MEDRKIVHNQPQSVEKALEMRSGVQPSPPQPFLLFLRAIHVLLMLSEVSFYSRKVKTRLYFLLTLCGTVKSSSSWAVLSLFSLLVALAVER